MPSIMEAVERAERDPDSRFLYYAIPNMPDHLAEVELLDRKTAKVSLVEKDTGKKRTFKRLSIEKAEDCVSTYWRFAKEFHAKSLKDLVRFHRDGFEKDRTERKEILKKLKNKAKRLPKHKNKKAKISQ